MSPRARQGLRAAGAVLGSVAFLAVLGRTLDLEALRSTLGGLRWGWFALAAGLGPLQIALAGWRWGRIARALGLPLPDGEAVREVGVSTALNQLLPGGVAGDVVRVWRSRRLGPLDVAVSAVVDRALGLVVLLAVAVGLLAVEHALAGRVLPGPAAVAVGAAVVGALGVASPAGRPLRAVLAADGPVLVALSAALVASFVLGYGAAALAVGVVPSAAMAALVPLVLLAMALPLSFAGWGPRETAAALLWPLVGATPEEGVAVAAAYGLSVLVGAMPGLLGLAPGRGIPGGA